MTMGYNRNNGKWLWNSDELGMWHTNMCFISKCLVDTLGVSEANLTRPLLFLPAGRYCLLSHGPPHPGPLFFCILCILFYVLFPDIFTPHSKIGRTLIRVCCCYLVAMSELPIMACLNSREHCNSTELWLMANQQLRCCDYTTMLSCFCVSQWGNLSEALIYVS